MINLIVCSLEGALLPEGSLEIPEEIIELIARLNKEGIRFAMATGRNYDAVKSLFGKVKNDIIYICNDGGVIIWQDKVISKTPIDRLVCMDVVSELEKENRFQLVFAGERNVTIHTHDHDFITYLESMGSNKNYDIRKKRAG